MSDLSPHETQARILEMIARDVPLPSTEWIAALTAGAQALRKEKNDDHARSDQPQLRACESDQRGDDRGGSIP